MIRLPHGETNVTLACQNKCVSCNHFIPLQQPWHADVSVIERDLVAAAKVMHFSLYNTVGGEPTLHPQIVDILKVIRCSGLSDRVECTSNGQNYDRLPDAFFEALDDLIITPYKIGAAERAHIAAKCKEFHVRLEWHPVIFTYAAYKRACSPERAAARYRNCWYAANRNVIDEGHFYRCCIGRFIPEQLLGLARTDDALPLDGLTEERLRSFLAQRETPKGCYVCASNAGAPIPWREERDRDRWIESSLGD